MTGVFSRLGGVTLTSHTGLSNVGGTVLMVRTATGLTGPQSITYSTATTTTTAGLTAYVFRGLTASNVAPVVTSTWGTGATPSIARNPFVTYPSGPPVSRGRCEPEGRTTSSWMFSNLTFPSAYLGRCWIPR